MYVQRALRGFALTEAAMLAAILVVLLSMLALSAGDSRRRAMLAASEENLHRLASATDEYAADNGDLYWAFSWKKNESHSQWNDLNNAISDLEAHANQAVDSIRQRADPNFPKQNGWIAEVFYSHLVLADFLDLKLPMAGAASAADGQLRGWQDNPQSAPNVRLPYSSSYELPTSFSMTRGARISGSPRASPTQST